MGYAFNTMKTGMLALAVAVLLGGPLDPAEAKSAKQCTLTVSDCTGDWNENASARPYCPSPTIAVSDCKCDLDGSCSITATVTAADGTVSSTTWTPSLDMIARPDQVDDIDVCFSKNSAGTAFTAAVRASCQSGETNSRTATNDGLCLANCSTGKGK